jgi:FADH2 O2-dependent halogenase
LLPNAAGFLDPLHSTGNALTLVGLERLVHAWAGHWGRPSLPRELAEASRLFEQEFAFVDGIVASSYRGFADFPRMAAITRFYFATAIWSEERRRAGRDVPRAFLCADQPDLQTGLARCQALLADPSVTNHQLDEAVRAALAPFDRCGLCDPGRRNMHPYAGTVP